MGVESPSSAGSLTTEVERRPGYRRSIMALIASSLLFWAGSLTPFWILQSDADPVSGLEKGRKTEYFSSLLLGCSRVSVDAHNGTVGLGSSTIQLPETPAFSVVLCSPGFHVERGSGVWVWVCQGLLLISASVLLSACTCALKSCICPCIAKVKRRRYIEIAAIFAGVLGLSAAIVFVACLHDTIMTDPRYSFSWALYVTFVNSVIVIVVGGLIARFNRPPANQYSNFK